MNASAVRLPPLILAAGSLLLAFAQPGPQPPASGAPDVTFRAESNLALVRFQVVAKKNDFVTDLRADEIELREDGIPQKIALFQGGRLNPRTSPIDIHLVFDCSGSIQKAQLLNPHVFSANLLDEFENVRIAIWGFSGKTLVYVTAPTRDANRLNGAMEALHEVPAGSSPIYRSLVAVAGQLSKAGGDAVRMVVAISDGLSYADAATKDDVVRAAERAGIELFPALVNAQLSDLDTLPHNHPEFAFDLEILAAEDAARRMRMQKSTFVSLAESTGGRAFEFAGETPEDLLDRILKQMAAEIRYDYTAGYSPASTGSGKPRRVQVVLKDKNRGQIVGGARYVQR